MDSMDGDNQGQCSTATVLLIDDEPGIRELYAAYPEQEYEVRTAKPPATNYFGGSATKISRHLLSSFRPSSKPILRTCHFRAI